VAVGSDIDLFLAVRALASGTLHCSLHWNWLDSRAQVFVHAANCSTYVSDPTRGHVALFDGLY